MDPAYKGIEHSKTFPIVLNDQSPPLFSSLSSYLSMSEDPTSQLEISSESSRELLTFTVPLRHGLILCQLKLVIDVDGVYDILPDTNLAQLGL